MKFFIYKLSANRALILDGMDGCDMRQETRDLVHLQPPSWRRTAVERRPYRMMMQAPDGSAVAAVVSSAPPTGRAQERTLAFGAYFAAMAFPFVPSELRGRTAKMSTFPAGSSAFGISSVVTPPCGSCPMPALTPSK